MRVMTVAEALAVIEARVNQMPVTEITSRLDRLFAQRSYAVALTQPSPAPRSGCAADDSLVDTALTQDKSDA